MKVNVKRKFREKWPLLLVNHSEKENLNATYHFKMLQKHLNTVSFRDLNKLNLNDGLKSTTRFKNGPKIIMSLSDTLFVEHDQFKTLSNKGKTRSTVFRSDIG